MEAAAAALEASELAALLKRSRWSYPAVNTLHVFGIALLFGAIVPLDLRLIGLWRRRVPLADAVALLRPVAGFGALLAVSSGGLLFIVQARDYVGHSLFFVKIGLVALGLAHALASGGLARATPARQAAAGALSLAIWSTVIVCGRMLGYL